MSSCHFATFLLSPSILLCADTDDDHINKNNLLTSNEKEKGLLFIETNSSANLLAIAMKFQAKIQPFTTFLKNFATLVIT